MQQQTSDLLLELWRRFRRGKYYAPALFVLLFGGFYLAMAIVSAVTTV